MLRRIIWATMSLVAVLAIMAVFYYPTTFCGEKNTPIRQQDLSARVYTPDNSGIASAGARSLSVGKTGVWLGYAGGTGVGHFDGKSWRLCVQTPHVNAIVLDNNGRPWVGTDAPLVGNPPKAEKSLMFFNGWSWEDRTWTGDKLNIPDYRVYGLTWKDAILYVATWSGVGRYDGSKWYELYSIRTNTFINSDHIHAIAFARKDTWLGTISQGVIRIKGGDDLTIIQLITTPQLNLSTAVLELGGDNIRKITVSPSGNQVWFAADPGDVTVYDYTTDAWTRHPVPGGKKVNDVQFDQRGRPCVATTDEETGGVYCLGPNGWKNLLSTPTPTYAVGFGCKNCPFSEEEFLAGTVKSGLVRGSILPHN